VIYTVYCSGSIRKGPADKEKLCWTDAERKALEEGAHPEGIRFLNPDDPAKDLSNTLALFGRDMYQVAHADFVVVDARERRGIGIGIEMVASRILETPLIAVVPSNTYYKMDKLDYRGSSVSNYIHPHLGILADAIVDDFFAAGVWIRGFIAAPFQTKGADTIREAIGAYQRDMLHTDRPMLELLKEISDFEEMRR
jgi:hypothetical protein